MNEKEIDVKIKDIIKQLTLEEKSAMIHGDELFKTGEVKRLNIPGIVSSDGPMGVRREFAGKIWREIGNSDDFVTYFPCNMALASTWNTDLAYEFGNSLGEEARGRGKDVILAPGINIVRTPLCGRNFEYMSEDPFLICKLAVPLIKGIQENDIAACVKHFALNNQEHDRHNINPEVDDRALNEIYFPGFKASVQDGNSYTIMGAYNRFKWQYCCESDYLLDTVLRDSWGYDGVVISDWGAVQDTDRVANVSMDMEMSVSTNFDNYFLAKPLIKRVKNGHIDDKKIDEKVYRLLKLMYRLKMFSDDRKKGTYNTPEHRISALKVAEESVVLLKNDKNLLPLDEKKLKSIAVIGENANKIHCRGGGSAEIKALYELTPLMGLKMKLGGNADISYARGYSKEEFVRKQVQKDYSNDPLAQHQAFEQKKITGELKLEDSAEYLRNEAIELAKKCDTVILFTGIDHDFDNEGQDRKDMKLPYEQDILIKEILKLKKDAIIVNFGGSPVEMEEWIDDASTVVHMWYSGMEGGLAIAKVLLGDVNPSGKLPITFPKVLEDSPAHKLGEYPGDLIAKYNESIFVGYRYFDTYNVEPRFAFGHGLSYTAFEYSNLKVEKNALTVKVTLDVKNIGNVDGAEIVQLYVSDLKSSLPRPIKELKGFKKIFLQTGEKATVELTLDKDAFSYYNDIENSWVCENGEFEVLIGSSSKDIRLKETFSIFAILST